MHEREARLSAILHPSPGALGAAQPALQTRWMVARQLAGSVDADPFRNHLLTSQKESARMSGGSYDYLFQCSPERLVSRLQDVRRMAERLRALGHELTKGRERVRDAVGEVLGKNEALRESDSFGPLVDAVASAACTAAGLVRK